MLLSQTAEYALRAIAFLTVAGGERASTAPEISAGTGIPVAYVSKVLRRMVQVGLLSSQRGHHGGFRLARAPVDIRLVEVLAAVDETLLDDRCIFGRPACDLLHPCPLHDAFFPLKEAVLEWSRRTTLEDVRLGVARPPPRG